jgi:DNA-binding MarR family transcriptional regulator
MKTSRLREPRRHDDLLNYRLKRLFNIAGAPAVRLCEGRYGVSRNEWRLLAALCEEGPLSPSALHELAGMDRGRVSRVVTELVSKRLASRQVSASDHRRAMIAATPAGERLYREMLPALARINQRLVAVLDDEELRDFEAMLDRLTEQARRIRAEGDGVQERANRRQGGARRVWAGTASALSRPAARRR